MKPHLCTPYVSPTPSQIALQDAQPAHPIVTVTHADAAERVRLVVDTRGCAPANVRPAVMRFVPDSVQPLPAHSRQQRNRRRARALSIIHAPPAAQPRDAGQPRGAWYDRLFIKAMTFLFGRNA